MRTIKFRGKSIATGEWLYGDLVHRDEVYIFPENGTDSPDRYEVIHDTIGQFTGLHDCKGQEIYEGDIISSEDDFIHVINYARSCACFLVTTPGDRYSTFSRILTQDWINEYQKKVIGNIHTNPELLKGGEE